MILLKVAQIPMSKKLTTAEFIDRSHAIHKGKYDYSKTNYLGGGSEVTVICPVHGEFQQLAKNHLAGRGCYLCRNSNIGVSKRDNLSTFVKKAVEVHGAKYNYESVEYVDSSTKVAIVCPEHGTFYQSPAKHLSGQNCPECSRRKVVAHHKQSQEELLARCRSVHADRYDYNKVDWSLSVVQPVVIGCKKHGDFKQSLLSHYSGTGCRKCTIEVNKARTRQTREEFANRAVQVHGNKYRYTVTTPYGNKYPVRIFCPTHGFFKQRPNDHLDGHGCPSCARITRGRSQANDALMGFIKTLAPHLQQERRYSFGKGQPRWRSDGYVPDKKLHIEFNGLRWHSTRFQSDPAYHRARLDLATQCGDRVIFIHEDEWNHKPDVVKHTLRHILGQSQRIFARKCQIGVVETSKAKAFYLQYHIQGAPMSCESSHGLFFEGELVACMSFSEKTSNRKNPYRDGTWELVRFASKYAVVGGASRLFKHFLAHEKPLEVISFSLNHLFTGQMYKELGFQLDAQLPPDYHYVDTKRIRRLHKSNFQHKRLQKRFVNYAPNETEEQNCARNNFFRIYDCGKSRWVWRADDKPN